MTAYVLRFIKNSKTPSLKTTGPLTATELYNVQRLWIQTAQQEVFAKEFTELKSKTTTRLPLIRQLRLFLNSDSLICCEGRIHNAPVSDSAQFPYLLPCKHLLTELIVRDTHEKHFHTGNKLSGGHYRVPDPPPLLKC